MTDLLSEAQPSGPTIDQVVAWLVLKTGKSQASNKRVVGLWVKAHGHQRVIESWLQVKDRTDIASPIGYLGGAIAKQAGTELGAGSGARAGKPLETRPVVVSEPPPYRITSKILAVRDRIMADWIERQGPEHQDLDPESKWRAEYQARRAAWVLAQEQLRDGLARWLP